MEKSAERGLKVDFNPFVTFSTLMTYAIIDIIMQTPCVKDKFDKKNRDEMENFCVCVWKTKMF